MCLLSMSINMLFYMLKALGLFQMLKALGLQGSGEQRNQLKLKSAESYVDGLWSENVLKQKCKTEIWASLHVDEVLSATH